MTRYAVTRRYDGTIYVHDFENSENHGPFNSPTIAARRCRALAHQDHLARSILYLKLFGRKPFGNVTGVRSGW